MHDALQMITNTPHKALHVTLTQLQYVRTYLTSKRLDLRGTFFQFCVLLIEGEGQGAGGVLVRTCVQHGSELNVTEQVCVSGERERELVNVSGVRERVGVDRAVGGLEGGEVCS